MSKIIIPKWRDYFRHRNQRVILSELQDLIDTGKLKKLEDVQEWITNKINELNKYVTYMDRIYAKSTDSVLRSFIEQMEKEHYE